MNGYVCFWKGKRVEVHADTLWAAKQKAVEEFQRTAGRAKVKSPDVSVVLAEVGGETITHVPDM